MMIEECRAKVHGVPQHSPGVAALLEHARVVTINLVVIAGVIVTSQIIRPQGPPIKVDWQLVVSDGRYKISDTSIDDVSMALVQRSEFAAIIRRNGRRVPGLVATMREAI
ncbi:MAG TPA: ABC transporter substrate-binding protein [Stellaceae bacterium]